MHTSDFKFDQTPVDNWPSDFAKLAEFSKRGVLALLSDSTNAERPGWTPSERVVDAALDQVFSQANGRIILASFASLISRMQQVANAAERHGRKLAFVGTSMTDNSKMAISLGYLDIPEDIQVTLDQALHMKDDEVVIMCTGSQGEPTSALGRLSVGKFRGFDIKPGDTVVLSSHPIPGNEEIVYRTINRLFERGANVLYEAIAQVHVSGHASQEEMKLMINLVRPKFFIPIHGELRQLKRHAFIAEQLGIAPENILVTTNGQTIELQEDQMKLGDQVPTSYVFVDGSGVGDVSPDLMREREELSLDGVVIVSLTLDENMHILSSEPEVITRGFTDSSNEKELVAELRRRIKITAASANGNLQADVTKSVKNYLYSETHRHPSIFVTINKI